MAKSQYTDSITGDILLDARIIDGKFIDYSPIHSYQCSMIRNTGGDIKIADIGKFGSKSLQIECFGHNEALQGLYIYKYIQKYTKLTFSWFSYSDRMDNNDSDESHWCKIMCYIWNKSANSVLSSAITNKLTGSNPRTLTSSLQVQRNGVWDGWYVNQNFNHTIANGSWHHEVMTWDGTTAKRYYDGAFVISANLSTSEMFINGLNDILFVVYANKSRVYVDDWVVIGGQILWNGNFTQPDYYLTGDHPTPKKLSKKSVYYPIPTDRNDYFDKAYLY